MTQESSALAEGEVEAISKEGECGAPPGFCWVKLRNAEYLAEKAIGSSLRIGEHVRFTYRNVRAEPGPRILQLLPLEPCEERMKADTPTEAMAPEAESNSVFLRSELASQRNSRKHLCREKWE